MAIGVLRGLADAGVAVPDQVSVIGFDNIFAADLVTPRLTTVAASLHVLGVTAVQNLLAFINGAKSRRTDATVLPVRLVERASTGRSVF
jgi:LacI family transcriptional regulator